MRVSATMVTGVVLAGALAASPATAQTPGEKAGEAHRVYEFQATATLAGPQVSDVAFFDVVGGVGGEVVTGAPYSAEAEVEFVQTLADGNRIVRRTTSAVHRDGQGRTRREVGPPQVGPLAAEGDAPRRIVIDDPVADVNWVLDSERRTARRQPRLRVEWTMQGDVTAALAPGGPGGGPPAGNAFFFRSERDGTEEGAVHEHVRVEAPGPAAGPRHRTFLAEPARESDVREESLGIRDFSGVAAEGTRRTVTIPAGRVGNERPLEIVTERWYSEELKTVVQSVRRDPRVGETTFRLRDLRLGEPDPALFEVPSGWTVEEGPGPGPIVIHEERDEPES